MIDAKLLIEALKQRIASHEKDADDFKEYEIKFDMEEMHLRLADECQAIIELIDKQPKFNEWITVSEGLPNCNGCYLVWRPHFFGGEIGMSAICYFDGQDTWHDSYGVDFTRILNKEDVIAWMPLAEPYKA